MTGLGCVREAIKKKKNVTNVTLGGVGRVGVGKVWILIQKKTLPKCKVL